MQRKAPPALAWIALSLFVAAFSLAHAQEIKTITVVLPGISQKIVNIPTGYKAVSAKASLTVTGGQSESAIVMVGGQRIELAWPDQISATIDLTHYPGALYAIPVAAAGAQVFPFSVSVEINCFRL